MIIEEGQERFMKCCVDTRHTCAGKACMGWVPTEVLKERVAMPDEIAELEKEGWRDRCELDKETGGTIMTKWFPGGRCGRIYKG